MFSQVKSIQRPDRILLERMVARIYRNSASPKEVATYGNAPKGDGAVAISGENVHAGLRLLYVEK